MTDEQIVRTLAEFMGMTLPEAMPDGYQSCPLWLESYDAIALVWRKTSFAMRVAACRHCEVDNWWEAKPRQHAEALAAAIQEAKK